MPIWEEDDCQNLLNELVIYKTVPYRLEESRQCAKKSADKTETLELPPETKSLNIN